MGENFPALFPLTLAFRAWYMRSISLLLPQIFPFRIMIGKFPCSFSPESCFQTLVHKYNPPPPLPDFPLSDCDRKYPLLFSPIQLPSRMIHVSLLFVATISQLFCDIVYWKIPEYDICHISPQYLLFMFICLFHLFVLSTPYLFPICLPVICTILCPTFS